MRVGQLVSQHQAIAGVVPAEFLYFIDRYSILMDPVRRVCREPRRRFAYNGVPRCRQLSSAVWYHWYGEVGRLSRDGGKRACACCRILPILNGLSIGDVHVSTNTVKESAMALALAGAVPPWPELAKPATLDAAEARTLSSPTQQLTSLEECDVSSFERKEAAVSAL